MAYTFLQLRGRVNDIPHRPKNMDAQEIDALVNDSYAYIVAELWLLQKVVALPVTPGKGDYQLNSVSVQGAATPYSWGFFATTVGDPGAGAINCDGDLLSTTQLWVSSVNANSIDMSAQLLGVTAGSTIHMASGAKWIDWRVTGPAVDNGGWVTIPVYGLATSATYPAFAFAFGDPISVSISTKLSDYAATRALYYNSTTEPLPLITTAELMAMRGGSGRDRAYCMNGWNSLSIEPLPAAGDTLTLWYSAYPPPLVNPTDTPDAIPSHLHHLIVGHCSAVAMEQIDLNYSQRMHEQFEEREMRRARRWLNDHRSSSPFAPGAGALPTWYPSDYFSPV